MATNRTPGKKKKRKRKENIVQEVGSAVHMFEAISFVPNASAKWKAEQSWKLEKFAFRTRKTWEKKEKIIKCIFRVSRRSALDMESLEDKKQQHSIVVMRQATHTHTHSHEQSAMPQKICDNWRFPIDKQICRNFNRLSLLLNNHSIVAVAHFAHAFEKEDYRRFIDILSNSSCKPPDGRCMGTENSVQTLDYTYLLAIFTSIYSSAMARVFVWHQWMCATVCTPSLAIQQYRNDFAFRFTNQFAHRDDKCATQGRHPTFR